jgi:hypothetical protein
MNTEVKPSESSYSWIAQGEDLLPERFPRLMNLSAAFMWSFVPKPETTSDPEFAYVPVDIRKPFADKRSLETQVTIVQWNAIWEAGHLRADVCDGILPKGLKWLQRFAGTNIYLLPDPGDTKYEAIQPLYHMLPRDVLERFGLPLIKTGFWPAGMCRRELRPAFPDGFDSRVERAFAQHIWPLVSPRSHLKAFSDDDPLVLLAHNLNFWIPFAYIIMEDRLSHYGEVCFENDEQKRKLQRLCKTLPPGVRAARPRRGGELWEGTEEAWEAAKALVEAADRYGKLRAIIDAVQSNRVHDDFSPMWSYAKEDFERKLYHKRSKVRVSFVQIDDSIGVHAPTSELHENLLWEDFLAILDPREKHITVCLKNGMTKVGEISKELGYANHSPISKALSRIRQKARRYLE